MATKHHECMIEKYKRLVQKLQEATDNRKLAWEKTSRDNEYQAVVEIILCRSNIMRRMNLICLIKLLMFLYSCGIMLE